MGTIYVYTDAVGRYRWRFRAHGNNEIMADSGQSYASKRDCLLAIAKLKAWFPAAAVVDVTA